MHDLAAQRRGVRFQGRRRAAEHERAVRTAHPFARHGERVVARHAVLFVRAFVRFVDDDEPQIRQRREQRAARADDDDDLAARRGDPALEALAFREARVQHGDALAERAFEAARRLRRERDLGDEHDRAAAAFERARDRAYVGERLPAAGDALQQHLGEAVRFDRRGERPDRRALFGRRREILRFAGPGRADERTPAVPRAQRAGPDRPCDERVREAREQCVAAPQRPRFTHERDEAGVPQGEAKADEVWQLREVGGMQAAAQAGGV